MEIALPFSLTRRAEVDPMAALRFEWKTRQFCDFREGCH
jgi:hypothetical protein